MLGPDIIVLKFFRVPRVLEGGVVYWGLSLKNLFAAGSMRDPLASHLRELLLDVRGMVGVLVAVCGWFAVLSERSERTVFQVECDVKEVCDSHSRFDGYFQAISLEHSDDLLSGRQGRRPSLFLLCLSDVYKFIFESFNIILLFYLSINFGLSLNQ